MHTTAVQADSTFYEDTATGKRYVVKMNTPEYEGLEKLIQEDGSCWPKGTKEFDDMIQYHDDHATTVKDVPYGVKRGKKILVSSQDSEHRIPSSC
ncbi:hypothetical protein M434DRAFT_26757 [Hypoxylon sp. CO27-5]|nr:hypothetical protein M434DRAFT_26757 [Hypoxylon sp. CO27-5]